MIDDQVDQGGSAGPGGGGPGPAEGLEHGLYALAVRLGAVTSPEDAAAELGASLTEVCLAVARLVELHLLRADADGRLLPIAPRLAVSALVAPVERSIYQWQELADRYRERVEAITRSPRRAEERVGVVDGVSGAAEIRGLFALASRACRDELVVLRPSHHDEDFLDELLETCYDVLDRGVAIRVVCPHHSRARFTARAKARRLLEGGAQIRTRSSLARAAVVFDESLAVLLDLPASDGQQPTARRVDDRGVVRFVIEMFNQHWEDATPFSAAEPGYAGAVGDLHRAIARLMAKGLTDDGVARHLGMSVRTCRRHIAALLQNLNSVSRFQAGVHAAALLEPPARPPVNRQPG
ncbi:hypothetical protein [Saccharothrix xinjiangensis]|uniref:HTH luxR-type domain-containing protein n=1 Tax=Saccharothrix xinjiangensis TaxID=204798 RepID=A0ABV9Y0A6_9PSEU